MVFTWEGGSVSVFRTCAIINNKNVYYGPPSADAAVALAVRGGGCQAAFAFHFYRAPQPLRVRPSHGPRYGSFALTVELEGGLQALSLRQARARPCGHVLAEVLLFCLCRANSPCAAKADALSWQFTISQLMGGTWHKQRSWRQWCGGGAPGRLRRPVAGSQPNFGR